MALCTSLHLIKDNMLNLWQFRSICWMQEWIREKPLLSNGWSLFRGLKCISPQAYFAAFSALTRCTGPIFKTLTDFGQHSQAEATWILRQKEHCVKSSTYLSKKAGFVLFWTVMKKLLFWTAGTLKLKWENCNLFFEFFQKLTLSEQKKYY